MPPWNERPLPRCLRGLRGLLVGLALVSLCACSTLDSRSAPRNDSAGSGAQDDLIGSAAPITAEARQRFADAVQAMERIRFEEARAIFEALAGQFPQSSGPPTNLGILAATVENDAQRAMAYFRSAVAANASNAVAHNWLGVLSRQQGAYAQAEEHYRAALSARPDYAFAHRNLGVLYDLHLQRPGDASRHYQAYRQLAQGSDALMAEVWLRALETEALSQPAVAVRNAGSGS